MMPMTLLQANVRGTARLHLEASAVDLQEESKRSDEGGTLPCGARPAVMPQDRQRQLFSHLPDRLLRRRAAVAAEALADATQAPATRATLELFAHGCVKAQAFSF